MPLGHSFDRYVIQARIMPVLLTVFPLASLVAVWLPDESLGWRLLSGLMSLILFTLIAQLGRDQGRARQAELFQSWGGMPSLRKLRHRDTDLPWITLERLHAALATAVGVKAPTKVEESTDPATADEVYSAYCDHLRDATRGDRILQSENISYGFRRNLWGLQPQGTWLAVAGLAGTTLATALELGTPGMVVPATAAVINATLLGLWMRVVNERWVRQAAEAYADRLLRAFLAASQASQPVAA